VLVLYDEADAEVSWTPAGRPGGGHLYAQFEWHFSVTSHAAVIGILEEYVAPWFIGCETACWSNWEGGGLLLCKCCKFISCEDQGRGGGAAFCPGVGWGGGSRCQCAKWWLRAARGCSAGGVGVGGGGGVGGGVDACRVVWAVVRNNFLLLLPMPLVLVTVGST
jgi:hypothetical protein